jgi:two-component system response regulator (stage 0 sporulation protein A)
MEIEKYLMGKGFYPSLKGFDYIVEAVKLIREDRDYKLYITKKLYPKIAEMFNDTKSKVERAIRHAINRAGLNYTNSEFIAIAEVETRESKNEKNKK